jgi:hypothetical protein
MSNSVSLCVSVVKKGFKRGANWQGLGFLILHYFSTNRVTRSTLHCIAEEFLTTEVQSGTEGPRVLLLSDEQLCESLCLRG